MKKLTAFWVLISMGILLWGFHQITMPKGNYYTNENLQEFSTKRALAHIQELGKSPHYIGTPAHLEVSNYLKKELEKLNLEVHIQDTMSVSKWNTLCKVRNVIAKIPGKKSGKALLLLTHYDSAPHSKSFGASDDANGLAVILEGIRAYQAAGNQPDNDIIILFSDAEELGLNGAWAFVAHHPWSKNVGVVVNFEARGTSGPSMMLAETNAGNEYLIGSFQAAKTAYPVSNSLMYSIYKLLPNDTDMTAFREGANIPGYTFAYIDDHYHYHTSQDNIEHFDPASLEHQASYLMPILQYYGKADLNNLNGKEDLVYFNLPKIFISYSFSWNMGLWWLACILFIALLFYATATKTITWKEIAKGFVPFFVVLIPGTAIFYGFWQLVVYAYPEYADMLHGYTYNGKDYQWLYWFWSLAWCFGVYKYLAKAKFTAAYIVAPLFIWLLICLLLNLYLPGAGFFIVPMFFALISWMLLLFNKKHWSIHTFLAIPSLTILFPLIQLFPVGLGLKILFGSALLTFLLFGLLYGVFGNLKTKGSLATLFLIIGLIFLFKAHRNNQFIEGYAKPNSLLYVVDANQNKAYWATYNKVLDGWLENYVSTNDKTPESLVKYNAASKYNSGFTYAKPTSLKAIEVPSVKIYKDTIVGDFRKVQMTIHPNRLVQRLDLLSKNETVFYDFEANGCKILKQEGRILKKRGNTVVSYYPTDSTLLHLSFAIKKKDKLAFEVQTSSFDLLENELFSVPARPKNQIPMPFVLTDAILVKKEFQF